MDKIRTLVNKVLSFRIKVPKVNAFRSKAAYTLGTTMLLSFKSVLLNKIPVFGSDGSMFIETSFPVWSPIPLNLTFEFKVFWLRSDIKNVYTFK